MISVTYHTGLRDIPKIIKAIKQRPDSGLKQLMNLVYSPDRRISMRASWVLLHFAFEEPASVEPLIPKLLKFLNTTNLHSGSIRNCIRIFTVLNIPEKYCAPVFDICMKFLTNPQMPHAVRAFSIQTMLIICNRYHELGYELQPVLKLMKEEPLAPSLNVWVRRAEQWFKKSLTPL